MSLYPEISPYRTGFLKVSKKHQIYFEESGNPKGKPVVFLHGGPGAGTTPVNRRHFNPQKYRIILFDQRACGKSTPFADLEENTTWDLVEDIEELRKHLQVSQWQVFGGSWGSTLALTYAITHPQKVSELILRGIFFTRRHEIQWFYQEGASRIFPDAFEEYRDFIPESERQDLLRAYGERLTGQDKQVQLKAARAWTKWELATSKLKPDASHIQMVEDDHFTLAFARIENHYFTNASFFESDRFLLDHLDKVKEIPGVIVHGRYDVVCPVENAWELKKAWPIAKLIIAPTSGHSALEPEIALALREATESFG